MDPPRPSASSEASSKEMTSLLSSEERGNPSTLSNVPSAPSAPSLQLLNPVDGHDMDPPSYSAVMAEDEIAERNRMGPSSLIENQPVPRIPHVRTWQSPVDPTDPITVQPQPSTIGFNESVMASGEPQLPNTRTVIIESTEDEAAKRNKRIDPAAIQFLPIILPDTSYHHHIHHDDGNCCEKECCGDDCCGDDCCGDDCCGDDCCGDDCCGGDADCGDCGDCADCGDCGDCTIL